MQAMAQVEQGWLMVAYSGTDLSKVAIAVGSPDNWQPAYLDYDSQGGRVAKIRPPAGLTLESQVWLRVDGVVEQAGMRRR